MTNSEDDGPRPGRPVRGSTSGRPVMALFDLVGRRWVMRIIWELDQAGTPLTFRELRGACEDISSSVLTRRLHELANARLVEHLGEGYSLTALAEDFVKKMEPLHDWSRQWAAHLDDNGENTSDASAGVEH